MVFSPFLQTPAWKKRGYWRNWAVKTVCQLPQHFDRQACAQCTAVYHVIPHTFCSTPSTIPTHHLRRHKCHPFHRTPPANDLLFFRFLNRSIVNILWNRYRRSDVCNILNPNRSRLIFRPYNMYPRINIWYPTYKLIKHLYIIPIHVPLFNPAIPHTCEYKSSLRETQFNQIDLPRN